MRITEISRIFIGLGHPQLVNFQPPNFKETTFFLFQPSIIKELKWHLVLIDPVNAQNILTSG